MGRIETALIRHYLKPAVTSDLPGRLRLSFKGYQMLPKEALPYLHYVQDVMTMLPGVRDAQVNPRIGTALVTYDASMTNREEILRWIATAVDTGLELAQEVDWTKRSARRRRAIVANSSSPTSLFVQSTSTTPTNTT